MITLFFLLALRTGLLTGESEAESVVALERGTLFLVVTCKKSYRL